MGFSQADYLAMQARLRQAADKSRAARLSIAPDAVEKEKDLHDLISAEVRRRGWVSVHSRMDRATTYDVGIADFIIFADGGRVIIVECKTRLGKLSIPQLSFIAQMEKLGHTVHVVRGFSEFQSIIK